MPDYPGTFIALEGSDGSGKGTQFKLLAERLKAVGYDVETFDFPRYDQPSSHFVKQYLNGDYGPASDISPYSASLFYALDRFEAAPLIRKSLQAGKVVLSNRYVGSNMAHQGAKFTNEAEQRGFFIWADSLEYQLLGIPRPALNLFLRLPAEVSQKLIIQRAEQNSAKLDQHEADIEHLRRAVTTYDTLCRLFPKDFRSIECAPEGKLLSVALINDMLWQSIRPLLPEKPPRAAHPSVVKFETAKPMESKKAEKPTPGENKRLSLLAVLELAKNGGSKLELERMVPFSVKQPGFFAPRLENANRQAYESFMRKLAGYREDMRAAMAVKKMANIDETLGLLLPMATYSDVKLPDDEFKSAATLSSLTELREAAKVDNKPQGKATTRTRLEKIAQERISGNLSTDMEPVTLLESWPRNEFDLLSDSFYGLSDLPRQQVQAGIEAWTYDQKYQALNYVLAEMAGTTASQVRYRWDVVAEQGLLIELILSGLATGLKVQPPTPRYGYTVPEMIEKVGLEGEYLECFDMSLELFSRLQNSNDSQAAAYVTLGGHKIRFQFGFDLAALMKPPVHSSEFFRAFRHQLLDTITGTQPITAEWLKKRLESAKASVQSKTPGRNRPRRRRAK